MVKSYLDKKGIRDAIFNNNMPGPDWLKSFMARNNLTQRIAEKKYANDKKVIDLSVLPPCEATLKLYIRRANYVANMWKTCCEEIFEIDVASNHGWYKMVKYNGLYLRY